VYRTIKEQREITIEAERRVRAGEPRAEVARALGIPLSTLSDWAHRGGWRRKDLVAVRNVERGKMVLGLINQVTADERERREADAAKLRNALEASKVEFAALAASGKLPGAMSEEPMPAHKLAMAMADSLLRQGQLEEADRAIRLAARFAETEHAASAREEVKLREERERLTKWWAEKQTDYHKLHAMIDVALGQMAASQTLEDSRSANQCCPKCNRRMDFWPEEVERPDDDDSDGADSADSDDSGVGDSDDSGDDPGVGRSGVGDFRVGESGLGEPTAEVDAGCHPHWKKDTNGSWYWDGPPGR
jgi:hypothetical protein